MYKVPGRGGFNCFNINLFSFMETPTYAHIHYVRLLLKAWMTSVISLVRFPRLKQRLPVEHDVYIKWKTQSQCFTYMHHKYWSDVHLPHSTMEISYKILLVISFTINTCILFSVLLPTFLRWLIQRILSARLFNHYKVSVEENPAFCRRL